MMFLRGIVSSNSSRSLSSNALRGISDFLDSKHLPSIVKNNMFEITDRMNKGLEFDSNESVFFYSIKVSKNKLISEFNEKVKRKEFAIFGRGENDLSLPSFTVDENTISSELSLVEQPKTSWLVLASKGTVDALEFKEEVLEHIQVYNNICEYLESTYGFDFKLLLKLSLSGNVESERYLKGIYDYESDESFKESLGFLIQYEEFYDYLNSEESGVLSYEDVS